MRYLSLREIRALILAHYYQMIIQEIADHVGDSSSCPPGKGAKEELLVLCGPFGRERKTLSPDKTVCFLPPTPDAPWPT